MTIQRYRWCQAGTDTWKDKDPGGEWALYSDALAAIETARLEERERILNAVRDVRDDERQMMSLRNAASWAIGLIHDNLPTLPPTRDENE